MRWTLIAAAATVTAGLLLPPTLHNNHNSLRAGSHSTRFAPVRLALDDDAPKDDDAPTDDTSADASSDALYAALRSRQKTLEADSAEIDRRWRKADCTSKVRAALDGWIRRLACEWPLAAIGTATGDVYVSDLSTGTNIAKASSAHPGRADGIDGEMRMLYDQYDGGGLLAIAFRGKRIVSAGRDGGAKSWLLTRPVEGRPLELVPQTEIVSDSLWASLVLQSDETTLWAGHLDGTLSKWALDGAPPTASVRVKTSAAVLAVAVDEERGVVAAGTADGGVELYALDGSKVGEWRPLAFDGSKGYKGAKTMSVAFAKIGDAVACIAGGSDGAMHYRFLAADGAASFDEDRPPRPLLPAHRGPVVDLAPARDGLLVSAAHDGTMRVWDLALAADGDRTPEVCYGLGGYKVWLGSVCVDDKRLISDGSDNTVVVHDFSKSD